MEPSFFESAVLIAALLIFLMVCLSALDMGLGIVSMIRLSSVSPLSGGVSPLVSLVVAACNEEDNIEQAMRTLLQQDYANLEIVALNDRSTDQTGVILERLQKDQERLKVYHIQNLPDDWMGKAHALNYGAEKAKGAYLLFTDGDIQMEKTTISRAMHHMIKERRDHITLLFKNSSPGWLLNSLILDAGAGLLQIFRPWLAKKSWSRTFLGVGAFNLVRKEAYLEVGGHHSIKMHPIDDIMLGKIIKNKGFRQECLIGYDLVSVPWYPGVGQMIEGLMKNVLAIINYRFFCIPPLLAVLFCLNILPLWGMLLADGTVQIIFTLTVLVKMISFYIGTRMLDISPWCALGTLLSPYITFYIVIKATWRNLRDNGIYWRGTYYPMEKLKKNKPLLF